MAQWLFAVLIFCGIWPVQTLASSNQSIVYQGRIVRPDGQAPASGSITFTLTVTSPAPEKCVLYSETQAVNMTGSLGLFSLQLGSGTRVDGGAHPFSKVFVNGGTLPALTCTVGNSYTPSSTDDRELSVSFNDAGTIVSLAAMPIKSVPFALQAHEIDGWGINNLVKVSPIGSPTTFSTAEMAVAKTITALTCANNEIIKWNGTAWDCAADATGGSPSDASYSTKGIFQADTDANNSGLTFSSAGVLKVNFGTGANQIVKLDGSAKLPALDGSALTNLSVSQFATGTLPISQGGTGATAKTGAFDALSPATTKGDLIVHNGTNNIRVAVGTDGHVLTADSAQASGVKWSAVTAGTVTNVTAGTGLNVGSGPGGSITSTGTLNVNVGTGASQIVQLDASAKLPAVDGSALTNLSAGSVASGTLPIARGGTGLTSFANNKIITTNGSGALQAVSCSPNQVISFDASGFYTCVNAGSLTAGFVDGGNSFGAAATLGTGDAYDLRFETDNTTRMTISSTGDISATGAINAKNMGIYGYDESVGLTISNGYSTAARDPRITIENNQGWSNFGEPNFRFLQRRGMNSAPYNALSGDVLGSLEGWGGSGSTGTDWSIRRGARVEFVAAENFTNSQAGTDMVFSTVANGGLTLTNRMRIKENGNVGIGTDSPDYNLDVEGGTGALLTNTSSSAYVNTLSALAPNLAPSQIAQINLGRNPAYANLVSLDFVYDANLSNSNRLDFHFYSAATPTLSLQAGGNAGVGTVDPKAKLDVNGQVRAGAAAPVTDPAGDAIDFSTGNVQTVTFTTCAGNALTVNLHSVLEGNSYSLILTVPNNCVVSFTGTTAAYGAGGGTAVTSFKYPGGTTLPSTGFPMVYSFLRANNLVFGSQVVDMR